MVYDGRLKSSDEIAHLFAKGPRNQDEVDILTEHIQREAKLISDAWTDKERETRAKRAGTPTPVPYSVQVVQVSKIQRVDTDG
tara:strand:+ start:498 stop:746 length:249 start_codon:yes stop_codon:yes gene_type:complete